MGNAKCEAAAAMKRNPRKINWTVLYRRKHKKGIEEEKSKKRTRRTTKFQRAITGATLGDIIAKREQAIRAAKERQKAKDATKKATRSSQPKPASRSKAPRPQATGSKPRVGGKR